MTKFQGLLNTCNLEGIQSCFLRKLTTPSLLVTPLTHPSSLVSICRILMIISLLHWSMREKRLLFNLLSFLTTMQSSQVSQQVPGPVCEKEFAICQELWQSQCHNKIFMVGTRCTTWHHKPCVSMTMNTYTTTILTFKIACVILSCLLQK
jgi:hypothetical protein